MTINSEARGAARRAARSGNGQQIRRVAGWSVRELAVEVQVAPSTISRWERGVRVPSGVRAERYHAALDRLLAQVRP